MCLSYFTHSLIYFPPFQISDEVEDTKESPEEVAANYICSMFQTYKDVLNGARHMV